MNKAELLPLTHPQKLKKVEGAPRQTQLPENDRKLEISGSFLTVIGSNDKLNPSSNVFVNLRLLQQA